MGNIQHFDSLPTTKPYVEQEMYLIRRVDTNRLMLTMKPCFSAESELTSHCFHWGYVKLEANVARKILVQIHHSVLKSEGLTSKPSNSEVLIDDPIVGELIVGLLESNYLPQAAPETITYAVQLLLAQLLELDILQRTSNTGFEEWQADVVTRSIRMTLTGEVTTEDIANRCGLSVCHFSRVFKATYGRSVYQFVLQERIKQAQERLLSTNDSITDIALDCGFSDQSSFTRRFTAMIGASPAAWRKRSASRATAQTYFAAATSPSPVEITAAAN